MVDGGKTGHRAQGRRFGRHSRKYSFYSHVGWLVRSTRWQQEGQWFDPRPAGLYGVLLLSVSVCVRGWGVGEEVVHSDQNNQCCECECVLIVPAFNWWVPWFPVTLRITLIITTIIIIEYKYTAYTSYHLVISSSALWCLISGPKFSEEMSSWDILSRATQTAGRLWLCVCVCYQWL